MVHKGPSIIGPLQAQSIYLPMLEMPIGWDTAAVLALPNVTGVGAKDKEGKGKKEQASQLGRQGLCAAWPSDPVGPYSSPVCSVVVSSVQS